MEFPRIARALPLALAALLGLAGPGCRRPNPGPAASAPTSASSAEAPVDEGLQAALDELAALPVVNAPESRPRVVSDPAPDLETWIRQVLVKGHEESGYGSGPGTADAREAIRLYARLVGASEPVDRALIAGAAGRARSAGCEDPLIRYLELRYAPESVPQERRAARAVELIRVCGALHSSSHHPFIKHLVALRTTTAARGAGRGSNREHVNIIGNVHMEDFIRDTNAPPAFVFGHLKDWIGHSNNPAWAEWVLSDISRLIEEGWSGTAPFHGFNASIEVGRAWAARGGGYAHTVTDEGWKRFGKHLDLAEEHLLKAWRLDPRDPSLPVLGLKIELGQGRGRAVAERWFERAMAIDPNHYDAAKAMAYYLEPRWHGSEDDCLRFARRCVRSETWGGRVPLVLVATHHSLAEVREQAEDPAYWGRPQVWADLQEAYEKFFRINTEEEVVGWRHDYARDAFLCGRHDVFLEQVGRFGGHTNHAFFGGAEAFAAKVAQAQNAVRRP